MSSSHSRSANNPACPPGALPEKVSYTKIIVKNLKLDMFIGVHDFEREQEQRVIVSVEATVEDNP